MFNAQYDHDSDVFEKRRNSKTQGLRRASKVEDNHLRRNSKNSCNSLRKGSKPKSDTIQNKYVFNSNIASGAYGTIIKGIERESNSEVAIKMIDIRQYNRKPGYIHLVSNEEYVLEYLTENSNNNHFPKYFESFINNTSYVFIVMQYIDGFNMESILKELVHHPLDLKKILYSLLLILEEFHRCGFAHRDLKPSNIMIDKDTWKLYLVDMGSVKILDRDAHEQFLSRQTNKEDGNTWVGTEGFQSPEMMNSQPVYEECDLWAFGIIMLRIFSGLSKIMNSNEDSFQNYLNELLSNIEDHDAADLIQALLQYNKNARPNIQEIKKFAYFNYIDQKEGCCLSKKVKLEYLKPADSFEGGLSPKFSPVSDSANDYIISNPFELELNYTNGSESNSSKIYDNDTLLEESILYKNNKEDNQYYLKMTHDALFLIQKDSMTQIALFKNSNPKIFDDGFVVMDIYNKSYYFEIPDKNEISANKWVSEIDKLLRIL